MKGLKKLLTGILAATLIMGSSLTVCAQDVAVSDGNATISIGNAARGETYKIFKLFDATVTGTSGGSIAYTGEIPTTLSAYFTKDNSGNITATADAFKAGSTTELSDNAKAAIKAWADSQTALKSVESDGSKLTFTGLPYGYYVVTTTQGDQAITVDSTNPNAELVDKNTSTPTFLYKKVDNKNVYIGEVVNYTVAFKTSNYENGKTLIESYYITDTLPDFLANAAVDSVVIDNDGDEKTTNDQTSVTLAFDENKTITIPWIDQDRNSLYKNGATVFIKYHGTVTKKAAIAGNGNTNHVDWGYNGVKKDEGEDTFKTYAIAIKKVDQNGNPLAGAKFSFPFAILTENGTPVTLEDGSYIYAGEGTTELETTKANGAVIVVRGLKSGADVYVTETEAPNGYNKLTERVKVTPQETSATTTHRTWLLDKNGNIVDGSYTEKTTEVKYDNDIIAAEVTLVVNKTGSLLPSTGGIGTTIFYILGGILIVAGVAYFMVRRKVNAE